MHYWLKNFKNQLFSSISFKAVLELSAIGNRTVNELQRLAYLSCSGVARCSDLVVFRC